MLGVEGIGTGVTFGTAGVVGTGVVCGFRVTGALGAMGIGHAGCVGLGGAGCGMEMWSLAGTCGMAVVASGTVSAGLTLHPPQVSSCVAVNGTITGVYQVAVLG